MRHHLDEFTVTDIRHTLAEVWRILRHRSWYFVFPFCIASVIALICSHAVPRKYTTTTMIRREKDPVFENMTGGNWARPYTTIHKRMAHDLKDTETIAGILADLGLPEELERFDNSQLTPRTEAARMSLAGKISKGLSIDKKKSGAGGEVIAIKLVMSDPDYMPEILDAMRDRYMADSRQQVVAVLHDVLGFFKAESERCRLELKVLQRQITEYELQYPGINPRQPDVSQAEQAALVVECVELERRLDEMKMRRQRLEEGVAPEAPEDQEIVPATRSNPRYAKLTREISRLLGEIADKKTLRGMTEKHPTIRQLRTTLAVRQSELSRTPAHTPVSEDSAAGTGPSAAILLANRRKIEAVELDAEIARREARRAVVDERLSSIGRNRSLAIGPRQDYFKLQQESSRVQSELQSWQNNIGPIEHIFTVEDRDRTIHFSTVQEALSIHTPSFPDAKLVTLVCFAIGVVVGALFVILSELADRSYRTVKQLKTSLRLPVIESIDEIITEAVHRKRLLRKLVMMPAMALICLCAIVAAGSMAYLSIENPGKYERFKSMPMRAVELIVGRS